MEKLFGCKIGDVSKFDDISGSFDGNTTTFALTFNGTPVTPDISPETIVLSLGGVVQKPTARLYYWW